MNIYEFRSLLNLLTPRKYYFDTEIQDWTDANDPLSLSCTFDAINVRAKVIRIMFRSQDQSMCLDNVKRIEVYPDRAPRCNFEFSIVCADPDDPATEIEYLIVADGLSVIEYQCLLLPFAALDSKE